MTSSPDPLPLHAGTAVVRRLAASDLERFQAYRHDPELARFQGWSAQSDADALAFLREMAAAPLLAPGQWTQLGIADPATSALIGDIGVFLAEDASFAEIGFTLARAAQGRGCASAAVDGTVAMLLRHSRAGQVVAVTDVRNLASIRLLERTGFTRGETRSAMYKGEACDEIVFTRGRRAA